MGKLIELDLSDCPYYRYWNGGEPGYCESGCRVEPSCITDRPSEGWPTEREGEQVRRATEIGPS